MATGPRVTLAPIPFNLGAAGATYIAATTPGYDLGSPSAITAWGGTAGGVCQVLVGDLVGATGQVLPATTYQYTIAANSVGWLGPWNAATYNQQAPTLVTYAGAINTTALTAAAQGCVVVDFTTTTTLAVRAYSLIPA